MSEYDYLITQTKQADIAQAARVGFSIAADANPDAYAEAQRVARRTGVPVDTVLNMPKEMKRQDVVGTIDFDTLAKTAPTTAALLADVERAKVAHDNVDNMGEIERKLRQFGGGAVEAVGMAVSGTGQLLDIAQRNLLGGFASVFLPKPMAGGTVDAASIAGSLIGEDWRTVGGAVKNTARNDMMVPADQQTFGDQVAAGLGQVVGQIAMLPLARGAGLYAQGADTMAEKVATDIAGQGMKDLAVLGGAAVTGITEKWALDRLLGPMAVPIKNQIAASMARIGIGAAAEGGQEFSENLLQDTLRKVLTNRDAKIDVGQSAQEGGVGAAVGGIVRSVVEAGLHIRMRGVRGELQAEQGAQFLDNINKLAAADKLLARDPETFEQFVAQAAEGSPVQQVFIDAQTLMQSGVAEQLAAVSPAVAAQLGEALQTGGQIAILVEEYAARIAPTEYAQGLLDHLKTEPEGFSRAEAQEYMQNAASELEAEVERTLAEKQGDDTFKASAEVVRADIKAQLDTAARFTPQVNDAYSAMVGNFYAVTAAKLNTTPEELFKRYPLKIGAERIDGQQFDQGGTLADLKQQWADAGIKGDITETGDIITLSRIIVPDGERGTGKGTAAMQALVDYADRTGRHVALSPSSDFGGNKKRLVQFYKRFGFVENKGKNRAFTTSESMYRQAAGKVLYQNGAQVGPFGPVLTDFKGDAQGAIAKLMEMKSGEAIGALHHPDIGDIDLVWGEEGKNAHDGFGLSKLVRWHPEVLGDLQNIVAGMQVVKRSENRVMLESAEHKGGVRLQWDGVRKHWLLTAFRKDESGADTRTDTTGADGADGSPTPASDVIVDQKINKFYQAARGSFNPATLSITLLKNADLSTFLHESGHFFLEVQADIAGNLQKEAEVFGRDTLKPSERQILDDTDALLRWFGVQNLAEWYGLDFEEKRAYHEQFARGFESYLFEGKAPSIELQGLFQRFRAWLVSVYRELKNLNVELTDEVRGVFDRMLATNEQIALAEQGRSMMPLFTSPEQAGMTSEEFAAYQALGVDATNEAIQDMQARGLRDMQWIHNTRGRIIKKLQRDAKEQRAAVEMDVRREVMSQPLYRAWTFLTAKQTREDMLDSEKARADYREALSVWNAARNAAETEARKDAKQEAWAASEEGRKKYRKDGSLVKAQQRVLKREEKAIEDEVQKVVAEWEAKNRKPADPDARPKSSPDVVDETRDSLFAAIGKLGGIDKAETVGTWGIDPADKPASGVFGKPVWRRDGGLSIDGMAEALSQYGYLTLDEHGKWDIRELEEKFRAELGGDVQVSSAYDYAADQQQDETISNPGGLTAGRLDMQALATMGLPVEAVNAIKARKMTAKAGLHPDIVAELFGFTSGDELVRKLAAAETPRAEIDALTDVRMLEQFGDLSSPQAIEKAADKAIHNDVRARMIATEANTLAKATGQRKVLASAAKEYASALISRLKVRAIKPGQYASAEVRAAKAAEKASKSGDMATAAAEKRNQLIQNYATRAAYDAQEEVDKGLRYLKKFEGNIKGLDADYAEQIGNLLERFDLRKGQSNKAVDKRTALAEWIKAQRDAGLEPDIPPELENEAFRTSYKNLTVEEFRGLLDTVKQIEHLGRLKHKLLTAADQRAYEAVRDEIAGSIRENAQGRQADTRTPTTNMGRALQGLKRFLASHIKAATWARVMDGGKDGGPMWEYFVRSANERGDQETTMRAEATAKLSEILAPVFKLGRMGGKGQFFPSINRSLNREARLAIALNTGNAGNLQRLLGGEGWTVAQLTPVLQSLTVQEWQAVQAVWDHFESYRPQIAAKERRVYGKEPEWVEPQPFNMTTADGATLTLRGGYYPIKYDPAASQRAEEHADAEGAKRQLQGAYTTATTRRSFTKARVEEVSGRPLLYSLAGMYSGVNDVIHDLAWHEWLIDANRLLRSNTIDAAIREHYGPEAKQQFKTWVQDVAEGDKAAANAGEAALGRLRQGVSAAGLGFNVMSAAIQITGFNQSIVRVGAPWIGRGVAKYLGDPLGLTRTVNEMSSFMENRARTRFRELNELRNRVQDQSAFNEFVGRYAYFMMMRVQQVVDVPTWWGAYEKAVAAGNEEARAIALADQAVIDAQGGGQTKDLSAIERGGPALRLFTVFYSFMNTALNLGVAKTMGADTPKKRAKLAVDYLMLYTVPAVLGYFIKNAFTPGDSGDDEPDEIARKLLAEQLGYLMGLMVVVREFNEVAKIVSGNPSFGYSGPAGLRGITDAQKFGQQAVQGEFDDAFRKSAINLLGDFTGLPSAQINRTISGAKALAEGKTDNPAAVAFGFQEPR